MSRLPRQSRAWALQSARFRSGSALPLNTLVSWASPSLNTSRRAKPLLRSDNSTRRYVDSSMCRERRSLVSKKPNLAAVVEAAGSTRRQVSPERSDPPVAPQAVPVKSKTRQATRQVAAHFPEEVAWQLRQL